MSTTDYASDPTRYVAGPQPRQAPGTLNHLFYHSAERYDKPDALQFKEDGRYRPISHRELMDRVRRVGEGLLQKGLLPGDRIYVVEESPFRSERVWEEIPTPLEQVGQFFERALIPRWPFGKNAAPSQQPE